MTELHCNCRNCRFSTLNIPAIHTPLEYQLFFYSCDIIAGKPYEDAYYFLPCYFEDRDNIKCLAQLKVLLKVQESSVTPVAFQSEEHQCTHRAKRYKFAKGANRKVILKKFMKAASSILPGGAAVSEAVEHVPASSQSANESGEGNIRSRGIFTMLFNIFLVLVYYFFSKSDNHNNECASIAYESIFNEATLEEYTCISSSLSTESIGEISSEDLCTAVETTVPYMNVNKELTAVALNEKQCRICFCLESESNDDRWMTPCKCDGLMKWVHQSCFEQWITTFAPLNQRNMCRFCGYDKSKTEKTKKKLLFNDVTYDEWPPELHPSGNNDPF